MPTKIAKCIDPQNNEEIAWLCDEVWSLPEQLAAFEQWLVINADLTPGSYFADIGFSVRENATGGGGALNNQMLSILVKLGMEVYLSEYHFTEGEE